jgi:hypothetical protein
MAALSLVAKSLGSDTSGCPSDEDLAAFVGGRLKGHSRRDMLAHLNRCPACYRSWLEVAAFVGETQPRPAPAIRPSLATRWEAFKSRFNQTWVALPVAAAAAAVLVTLMVLPAAPDKIDSAIDASYAAVLAGNSAELAQVARTMPVPWAQDETLGFGEASLPPSRQAYSAGLWEGLRKLAGQPASQPPAALAPPAGKAWADSDWSNYYALGRWTVLAWTLSNASPARADWPALHEMLAAIESDLKSRPDGDEQVIRAIGKLQAPLNVLRSGPDEATRADLSRNLTLAMQQLAH